jgi:hypothetical protein
MDIMSRSPRTPTVAARETARAKVFWREDRRLLIGAGIFAIAAVVVERLVHLFGIVR